MTKSLFLFAFFLSTTVAWPDELVLRSLARVHGKYYGGTSQSILFAPDSSEELIKTYNFSEVKEIVFSEEAPSQSSSTSKWRPFQQQPDPSYQSQRILRTGTNCTVRLIDPIDSKRDALGQTFRANLDVPIYVNGQLVVPYGSDVLLTLIDDQNSGHFGGKTSLTVKIRTLTINGRPYPVHSSGITKVTSSRGVQSAQRIGAGTGVGAAIGALAGGERGAGIGALAGAAAGTIAQLSTSGQQVKLPSETRLTFALADDLPL